MPTYEYGCAACGNEWEIEQRISAEPIKKCPKCKKLRARRLISGGNFILKGGGWYSDLYHKPPASSAKSSSETSSDSKSSDAKASGESKSSEAKGSEPKSSEAKPPSKKAANE